MATNEQIPSQADQRKKPPEAEVPHPPVFDGENVSLVQEFWLFVKQEKQWWLVPILLALGTLGILATLTSTGAAPFIYTLF